MAQSTYLRFSTLLEVPSINLISIMNNSSEKMLRNGKNQTRDYWVRSANVVQCCPPAPDSLARHSSNTALEMSFWIVSKFSKRTKKWSSMRPWVKIWNVKQILFWENSVGRRKCNWRVSVSVLAATETFFVPQETKFCGETEFGRWHCCCSVAIEDLEASVSLWLSCKI